MNAFAENRARNDALLDMLDNPGTVKQAEDTLNAFTRTVAREDGFLRKLVPAITVQNDDLTPQYFTDKPMIVLEKEPDLPPAVSVPFGTLSMSVFMRAPRYVVSFADIQSYRFRQNVNQLRTYRMDIRQIFADNAVKQIHKEEDSKFIAAVNIILGGAAGATAKGSDVAQWQTIGGGITRDTLQHSFTLMPRARGRLEVRSCLVNNVTFRSLSKFGRDEMGGDFSQEVFKSGWKESRFMDATWYVTIKHELVPHNYLYMFAEPERMGKFLMLEDITMYIDRKMQMLEFCDYETVGLTLANVYGFALAVFTG